MKRKRAERKKQKRTRISTRRRTCAINLRINPTHHILRSSNQRRPGINRNVLSASCAPTGRVCPVDRNLIHHYYPVAFCARGNGDVVDPVGRVGGTGGGVRRGVEVAEGDGTAGFDGRGVGDVDETGEGDGEAGEGEGGGGVEVLPEGSYAGGSERLPAESCESARSEGEGARRWLEVSRSSVSLPVRNEGETETHPSIR